MFYDSSFLNCVWTWESSDELSSCSLSFSSRCIITAVGCCRGHSCSLRTTSPHCIQQKLQTFFLNIFLAPTAEAVIRQHGPVFILATLQVNLLSVGPLCLTLCSTHWATQAVQRPLSTAVLMSCSATRATEEHSWGVCVALSALMSCAFSFHPVQDWWSGSVTCKRVLRRVAFPAWAAGGQGAPLYDCLRCHIDEGRIGSSLIWVLHHGDVWSSRPGSSSGTRVCTPLWLFG